MKITTILLICVCLQVSAYSHNQKVTLSVHHMPLQKLLSLIEKQTGYAFFYDFKTLNGRVASLNVKDADIGFALKKCFRHQPLEFMIVNTTVAIREISRSKISSPSHPKVDGEPQPEQGPHFGDKREMADHDTEGTGNWPYQITVYMAILFTFATIFFVEYLGSKTKDLSEPEFNISVMLFMRLYLAIMFSLLLNFSLSSSAIEEIGKTIFLLEIIFGLLLSCRRPR